MAISRDHQLVGKRLILRGFTPPDAPAVHAIWADWGVARWLRRAKFPPRTADAMAWIAASNAEWASAGGYGFAASIEGRLVGCIDIANVKQGSGELGYWFERASWSRGLAGEAVELVKNFAIRDIGLHRLTAGHAAENVASGRVLLRAGFRLTGDDGLHYPLLGRDLAYLRYAFERQQ